MKVVEFMKIAVPAYNAGTELECSLHSEMGQFLKKFQEKVPNFSSFKKLSDGSLEVSYHYSTNGDSYVIRSLKVNNSYFITIDNQCLYGMIREFHLGRIKWLKQKFGRNAILPKDPIKFKVQE